MKNKLPILIVILVLVSIYWQWWISGPRVASDFSQTSSDLIKSQLNIPQTWSNGGTEGLGEYTVFTLWSWPYNLLQGILGNLGISFNLIQRILFIIPFLIIGGTGIWKIGKTLSFSSTAKIISTIFYLTNTYILLVIDGGQLSISLAYALFPWAFMLFKQSLSGDLKKKVLTGLVISAIGIFDIRFIYIFFMLCSVIFFYEFLFIPKNKWLSWVFKWIKMGFVIGVIILGLNAHWILVLIKHPISAGFYQHLTQTSFTSFISFSHVLLLLSPHWYKNIFGRLTDLRLEFFLIPTLVFLAPILKKRDKNVGFWFLVALISIFLTKGTSDPLGGAYQWLYYNIPGFSLFRDSSKFFFLVALSYAVLIGITTDQILVRINNSKTKILVSLMLGAYFIFLVWPVWSGQMTGAFSQPVLQKEYLNLNEFIKTDKDESNIFWIPTISPLTELDTQHPAVEASRLVQKRPFAQGAVGAYEAFNFLREAPYMGELFDVANIGFLVYPPLDLRRADLHPDNINYYYTFLNQLSNLPWLTKVENSLIPLFKVNKHQEKLFIVPNIWWVIGSDTIYNESTKSAQLALSKNALIFAEESSDLGKKIDELSQVQIILNNKTPLDLAAGFLNKDNLIFPANGLKKDPDSSGWWKRNGGDLIAWKDFLKTKYGIVNQDFDLGGGWAIGEGNRQLTIENEKWKIGNVLLARVLESSRSGQLKFLQNNKLIGLIKTASESANVRWFEVGSLIDGSNLTVKTQGDINVVNAIATVDKSLWQEYKAKANGYQDRVVNFGEGVQEASPSVSYKQINPTKYKVTIQNLKQASMLIFSQNFDNNWKLDGKSPFPVYSLLNGYSIEKNGEYELIFEPQKYVFPGLLISGLTLVVLSFLLVKRTDL